MLQGAIKQYDLILNYTLILSIMRVQFKTPIYYIYTKKKKKNESVTIYVDLRDFLCFFNFLKW